MKMWLLRCCFLYLLTPLARGDAQDAQRLNELGSRSRLLCANALAYFNPQERDPDPRSLTSLFFHLNTIDTRVTQLGRPETLQRPLTAMQALFKTLTDLPRDQAPRYPALVGQLLEQSRQLQLAAEAAAASLPPADSAATADFGKLSQALASLLLDYQLRGYPLPGKQIFLLGSQQVLVLEEDIARRFNLLEAAYPEQATELGKARGSYSFVRAQLRQDSARGHGGAEFYLGRAITDLDELAMAVLPP